MNKPIGINEALLCGVAAADAVPSHVSRGRTYMSFPLQVRRLSGAKDTLNVLLPQERLPEDGVRAGDMLAVTGQLRSFNNKSGEGNRLVISVYALSLEHTEGEHENSVHLGGVVCKPPTLRKTPLGREICDVMLAVNRHYGRADYLPVILWGAAAMRASALAVGDALEISGRIQSRTYIKQTPTAQQERTAFEVSAIEIL